jgi:hypothetical protein
MWAVTDLIKCEALHRARDGLQKAARAVGVDRADHAEVAGAVEPRNTRAVCDGVASSCALAIVWTRHSGLRNGVVCVEPRPARLAVLAEYVAQAVALQRLAREEATPSKLGGRGLFIEIPCRIFVCCTALHK